MDQQNYIQWIRSKVGHEKISKDEKPELFTKSHDDLWDEIWKLGT